MMYILVGSGFLLLILAISMILRLLIQRRIITLWVGYLILYTLLLASVLQYLVPTSVRGLRDLQIVVAFLALMLLLTKVRDCAWGFYKDSGTDHKGE